MSMDLHNNNGHFKVGTFIWCKVLQAAREYGGWQPMGVQLNMELLRWRVEHLPKAEQDNIIAAAQPGDYSCNDGDVMTGEDAKNLAEALTVVLDDIPEFEIKDSTTVLEYFSGPETRAWLESLIAYLHNGGNVILA